MIHRIKNFLSSKWTYFLLLIFLLPLLFLNVRHSHDWGDDFAQYLIQAESIIHPDKYKNVVLYGDNHSPAVRGLGFSLILTCMIKFFGSDIHNLLLFNSLFIILSGLILYKVYKREWPSLIAFLMVLVVFYNYWFLQRKVELLSEFCFMFLFVSLLEIYRGNSKNKYIYLGFLSGILILVRNIGVVIPLSIGILDVISLAKKKERASNIFPKLLLMSVIIAGMYFATHLIFGLRNESFFWYTETFIHTDYYQVMITNLVAYLDAVQAFFLQSKVRYVNILASSVGLTLFGIGFIDKARKKLTIYEVVTLIYWVVLLFYEYNKDNVRFLFPLYPIILIYAAQGIKILCLQWDASFKYLMITVQLLFLYLYSGYIEMLIPRAEINGPYSSTAIEAFSQIKKIVPADAVVSFSKPMIIMYYCNRSSMVYGSKFINEVSLFDSSYVLVSNSRAMGEIYDPDLYNMMAGDTLHFNELWQNKDFSLFQYSKGPDSESF